LRVAFGTARKPINIHDSQTIGGDDLTSGNGKDRHRGDSGNDSLFAHDGVKGNDLANGEQGTDSCSADKKDEKVSGS
jgi:hypothetical protein